jgi:hypothetical protein
MEKDILPESRLTTIVTPKRMTFSPYGVWVPIFCANCGKDGGNVPEDNFAFWLCNDCYAKHGVPAGLMAVPDEVFWEKVAQAQMEEHGRLLSEPELIKVSQENASPLATLLNSRR